MRVSGGGDVLGEEYVYEELDTLVVGGEECRGGDKGVRGEPEDL